MKLVDMLPHKYLSYLLKESRIEVYEHIVFFFFLNLNHFPNYLKLMLQNS